MSGLKERIELSAHARDMLAERHVLEEWMWRTLNHPRETWAGSDGNVHFARAIEENGDRVLHLVVNAKVKPECVVTVFFDRRLKERAK